MESSKDRSGGPSGKNILQGTIDRVTFRAADSGYTVLQILPEQGFEDPGRPFAGGGDRICAVGTAPELSTGQRVRLAGRWTEHPAHGRQLAFESVELLELLDSKGLIRYLSSQTFRGVGAILAARLVEALGPGALAKLRDDPAELARVKGLSAAVRANLVATIRSERGSQESFAFLLGLGLGASQAQSVLRKFGSDTEQKVRENPYALAQGIRGIAFKSADRIALRLGVAPDAPERRRAGILHVLAQGASEGHSCLHSERLRSSLEALFERALAPELLQADLEALSKSQLLMREEDLTGADEDGPCCYLPYLFASEAGLAENLAHLLHSAPARPLASLDDLRSTMERERIDLHADQRAAVLGLLANPVALLTGGPGVGKTTIVRLVLRLAERAGAKVALASPTGRAAKRLCEVTGRDAATVHRLLGWDSRAGRFAHRGSDPLRADLVIVDEISMLDVVLAHHLVKAIQPPSRLIFVGDPNQLPAVSAGNVLAELLAGGDVPAFRLTKIFRQERESLIVSNAHRILEGGQPRFPKSAAAGGDFFLFPAASDSEAAERLVEVVTERIPRRFGLNWVEDVQVLCPMYRGHSGVDALNVALRKALGTGGREVTWRGRTWRLGDRVIHTKNDYEREIFNGDMGRITHIASDGSSLCVRFGEREISYTSDQFADLQAAFAITVHRAQGCEFPAVVMPLVMNHALMLQRHLLYTGITRAKRLVVLVAQRRALAMAVQNASQAARESLLSRRLHQALQD